MQSFKQSLITTLSLGLVETCAFEISRPNYGHDWAPTGDLV